MKSVVLPLLSPMLPLLSPILIASIAFNRDRVITSSSNNSRSSRGSSSSSSSRGSNSRSSSWGRSALKSKSVVGAVTVVRERLVYGLVMLLAIGEILMMMMMMILMMIVVIHCIVTIGPS